MLRKIITVNIQDSRGSKNLIYFIRILHGNEASFTLKHNLTNNIYDKNLKPYQKKALTLLKKHPEGISPQQLWNLTSKETQNSISRASLLNFIREYGKLEYRKNRWFFKHIDLPPSKRL